MIANLYPESLHIVAHAESNIRSVRDLVGKRVSLDEPGSGTLVDARIILEAFGVSEADLTPHYLKQSQAIAMMDEGELDAFFIVAGYPTGSVLDFCATSGCDLVPIEGPEVDALLERYPYFARDTIPAGTYPGVGRTQTLSVGAQWLVGAEVDEELVYGITKALWHENARQLLDNGHAKGQAITLATALDGVAVPAASGRRALLPRGRPARLAHRAAALAPYRARARSHVRIHAAAIEDALGIEAVLDPCAQARERRLLRLEHRYRAPQLGAGADQRGMATACLERGADPSRAAVGSRRRPPATSRPPAQSASHASSRWRSSPSSSGAPAVGGTETRQSGGSDGSRATSRISRHSTALSAGASCSISPSPASKACSRRGALAHRRRRPLEPQRGEIGCSPRHPGNRRAPGSRGRQKGGAGDVAGAGHGRAQGRETCRARPSAQQQRGLVLGRRQHLEGHLGHGGERAEAAGEQLAQIVAGDVLDHAPARLDQIAAPGHRLHAEEVVARGAGLDPARTGEIAGEHAADRAAPALAA